MSKSKKKPKPRDSFMVRLPESYRELLTRLTAKTRRTMTVEVQIALDRHAKDQGIEPVQ